MKAVDLHVHSNKSDGSNTPSELVDIALNKGLAAFALTDHDTTEGLDEALEYAKDKDVEVIPGIELSSEYKGRDIHIVGLFIDHNNSAFKKHLIDFQESRITRNNKMCALLHDEVGMDISYKKLMAEYPGSVITRAHYARYMLAHGYVKSLQEAFERYIGDHCKYFIPREKITPEQAVKLILGAGGIPVLAHPVLYKLGKEQLDILVASLKDAGLQAIEAIYSTYAPSDERDIKALARKYNLAISGGSDYHGEAKPSIQLGTGRGHLFVYQGVLDHLKELHGINIMSSTNTMNSKKIFFTDLDETLLTSDKKISTKMHQAIMDWMDAGNPFVLCSGRPTTSVRHVAKEFSLAHDNLYCVGFNGAEVYHPASDTVIIKKSVTPEQIKKVYEIASSMGIHSHCYSDDSILAHHENEELLFYTRTVKLPIIYSENYPDNVTEDSCKVLCICMDSEESLEALAVKLREAFNNELTCILSNSRLLEVFNCCAGKGSAVTELCEILGIDIANSYAAGDQQNDISMIEAAGTGIAMKNARASVQSAANVITENDNNNDGLLPYIKLT